MSRIILYPEIRHLTEKRSSKLHPIFKQEMLDWLDEYNIIWSYDGHFDYISGCDWYFGMTFFNEEDAVAFKLRWL
ncbi:hypothetical protein LCGC14_0694680 [marine sediment metagenome]|uniref:Uncharacterized protein n=1 Tax=marine sediment metagenome TaxID=412755 RepID=A0A0F9TSC4_9ZZZZ